MKRMKACCLAIAAAIALCLAGFAPRAEATIWKVTRTDDNPSNPAEDTVYAAVREEMTARTTADEALAKNITTLEAIIGDPWHPTDGTVYAAIRAEETARVTRDEALAKSINTLSAIIGDPVSPTAGTIYGKEISQKMDSVVLTGHQLAIGGLVLVVAGHASGGALPMPTWGSAALMMLLVTISAVSFVLWTTLLKHNRVGGVAVFNLQIPIFGSLLSAAFLGESILEPRYALALVLVCVGIWLVNREEAAR